MGACAEQDAFGENDVYIVTTLGVGKLDQLKDEADRPKDILSHRLCPDPTGASRTHFFATVAFFRDRRLCSRVFRRP